jgi:uncharacterized surface anchored protein
LTGVLTLTKYGTDVDADNNKPVLSGAVFGIFKTQAEAEAETASTTTAYKVLTTNANGTATSEALDYGTYWVRELTAPTGYQLDSTARSYAVGKTNGTDGVVSVTWDNVPLTGVLALTKHGSDTDADGNKVVLAGAVFGVYDTKAKADAAVANDGTAVAEITTNADGYAVTDALAYGTYWVKELTAPTGYQLDSTVYGGDTGLTVGKTSGTNGVVTVDVNDNIPQKGTLNLTKYGNDTDGNRTTLKDAVFGVYDTKAKADAAVANDGTAVDTITTDANGYAVTKDLDYGAYWVKELVAPNGYRLDSTVYGGDDGYTVGKTQTTVTVTVNDNVLRSSLLTIKKTDSATSENLSGAVYTVYSDKDCTVKAAEIEVTNGVGSVELSYGTYYIKETTAPNDYRIDSTVYGPYTVGGMAGDVEVSLTDVHKLAVPTGIRMEMIPYLLTALMALVFLTVVRFRKKGKKL